MKNWKYFELITTYYNCFFSQLEGGMTIEVANSQNLDDFWNSPDSENLLPNLIIILLCIRIDTSLLKKLKPTIVNMLKIQMALIDKESIRKELSEEEFEDLNDFIYETFDSVKRYYPNLKLEF